MELDFYYPDQLVAVEFQGDHHYCPTDYCADHNSVQRRDRLKRQICRSRGINVVTVDAIDLIKDKLRAKLKYAVKRIRPRVHVKKVNQKEGLGWQAMTHAELEKQLDLAIAKDDLGTEQQLLVVLTPRLIQLCRTSRGGFTNATLRALGMTKSTLVRGWPDRLIGKSISAEAYRVALAGRNMYSVGPLPKY